MSRPGGAPFINGLPQSVVDRYHDQHPEQRTAAKSRWVEYDDLPEPAQRAAHQWFDEGEYDDPHEQQVEKQKRRFTYHLEHVPVEEAKGRALASGDLKADWDGDWDSYHRWYTEAASHWPDRGPRDSHDRWPALHYAPDGDLHQPGITGDYFDDGWHRFHHYVAAGDTHIPVLHYQPKSEQRTAAREPEVLYHGTMTPPEHTSQHGLMLGAGLSDEGMLGEDVTHAVFMTPDPDEAAQYGPHVWQVDARGLDLEKVDGPEGYHYVSLSSIPADRLTPHKPQHTAARETLYHYAPAEARGSIAQHGLDWRRGPRRDDPLVVEDDDGNEHEVPRSNYLYRTRQSAVEALPEGHDLYEVDASGLSLEDDPYEDTEAVLSRDSIPAHRLRRVQAQRVNRLDAREFVARYRPTEYEDWGEAERVMSEYQQRSYSQGSVAVSHTPFGRGHGVPDPRVVDGHHRVVDALRSGGSVEYVVDDEGEPQHAEHPEEQHTAARKTMHFYPARDGGKYHLAPSGMIENAACRGSIMLDKQAPPIVIGPEDDRSRVHPIVCRRCLSKG